jgi:hypothetical protein
LIPYPDPAVYVAIFDDNDLLSLSPSLFLLFFLLPLFSIPFFALCSSFSPLLPLSSSLSSIYKLIEVR